MTPAARAAREAFIHCLSLSRRRLCADASARQQTTADEMPASSLRRVTVMFVFSGVAFGVSGRKLLYTHSFSRSARAGRHSVLGLAVSMISRGEEFGDHIVVDNVDHQKRSTRILGGIAAGADVSLLAMALSRSRSRNTWSGASAEASTSSTTRQSLGVRECYLGRFITMRAVYTGKVQHGSHDVEAGRAYH